MLGCMLARRTVAATDVPTLPTPAEVKPPTSRRTPGVPHTHRHSTSKRDSRTFIANQISLSASVGLARRTPMRVQPPTS
jgi:hypothetical protein